MPAVARRQAFELSRHFEISLISDAPAPESRGEAACVVVAPPTFRWLRRFGHVPRELAFARSAFEAVKRIHAATPVALVLCHSHVVAAACAEERGESEWPPYALVTHGDIFDRPEGTYDERLTRLYRRVTPLAYRNAACVVALSPRMAALARQGGADSGRVVVIPNGIDARDFGLDDAAPWSPPPEDGPFRLLYVGRLGVEKGVDVLIRALAVLARSSPQVRLEIVGTGPSESQLRALAGELAVANIIEFVGSVSRQELAARYLASHVVCVPSRSDALPTVALEAARAGRAVVASTVGGLPAIVEDGRTGVLVAPDASEALGAALGMLAAQRDRVTEMGAAARERADREFDWQRVGERLAAALEAAMESAVEEAHR